MVFYLYNEEQFGLHLDLKFSYTLFKKLAVSEFALIGFGVYIMKVKVQDNTHNIYIFSSVGQH
jgi:hypothetical protein